MNDDCIVVEVVRDDVRIDVGQVMDTDETAEVVQVIAVVIDELVVHHDVIEPVDDEHMEFEPVGKVEVVVIADEMVGMDIMDELVVIKHEYVLDDDELVELV